MNVADALHARFTTRAFKRDGVSKETILKVMEIATRTPSWANTQPWEIFVATGEPLERLREAFSENFRQRKAPNADLPAPREWPAAQAGRSAQNGAQRFEFLGIDRDDRAARRATIEVNYQFFGAPAVAYVCMDRTLTPWSIFDLGLFTQSIMLAAQQFGLHSATAYLLAGYPELLRAELGIKEDLSIIVGVALGYAELENPLNQFRSGRRPVEEVVRLIGFEGDR